MQVKELYHPVVVTADAGESLASAARRMVVHGIGSLVLAAWQSGPVGATS